MRGIYSRRYARCAACRHLPDKDPPSSRDKLRRPSLTGATIKRPRSSPPVRPAVQAEAGRGRGWRPGVPSATPCAAGRPDAPLLRAHARHKLTGSRAPLLGLDLVVVGSAPLPTRPVTRATCDRRRSHAARIARIRVEQDPRGYSQAQCTRPTMGRRSPRPPASGVPGGDGGVAARPAPMAPAGLLTLLPLVARAPGTSGIRPAVPPVPSLSPRRPPPAAPPAPVVSASVTAMTPSTLRARRSVASLSCCEPTCPVSVTVAPWSETEMGKRPRAGPGRPARRR